MLNAQVVQPTGEDHRFVRETFCGVAENILHHARTLDSSDGMFNAHPHL